MDAFAEEFVFRGVLQRTFVERYGLYRGVSLVGVIWGVFHFPGDHYFLETDFGVLQKLLFRVVGCVVIGFVLSWLTLRSGSVLPASLAHGVSNLLIHAGFFHVQYGEILRLLS